MSSPTRVLRLFTDGAARGNPGPAGLGLVLEDEEGMRLWGGHRYVGTATNNQAEYLALIEGLQEAARWNPDRLEVYMDSLLVVEQLAGRYRVKNPDLRPLHARALALLGSFRDSVVSHVPREKNRGADALANRAIDENKPKS
jgi:ribonuclease HI